tara:strand:+ start:4018 stop:5283 length:1266 start_codon:yes stop_codon:yes gene_type:complete
MINKSILKWLSNQRKKHLLTIKKKDLNSLDKWVLNKREIYHQSKKFFKIVGLRIQSNFYKKKKWDQPIIVQNEIGILGIIKNLKTKKYLLQAKVEPGNINKIQISPTVQATRSNYSRIHKGKTIPYLKYFIRKNKNFSLQSEQPFRYLNKKNSNIISNVSKKINLDDNFRWFSKKEINSLLKKKNIINMDTLSVFSSFVKKKKNNFSLNSDKKIYKWSNSLDKKYFLRNKIINLNSIKKWNLNKKKIFHKKNVYFSVIGINVKTNKREITEWDQPIIQGTKMAFTGYLVKKFKSTDHYLCRYILKPGSKESSYTCSVNTSKLSNFKKNEDLTDFQKKLLSKYFINSEKKLFYDNILSDEGGRFYHSQIRYMVYKLKKNENITLPENYIWFSQNQIIDLIKKQKIDIEARLLFGIINFKETI